VEDAAGILNEIVSRMIMNRFFRWPDLPSDFSGFIHRKAEDLYEIPDAEQADNGLIHCTVLPIRDLVLFPNMVTPLFLETESSMKSVEQAISSDQIRDRKTSSQWELRLLLAG